MESLLLLKYPRGYFSTSKGQSRVHCPCEKWEDCPVYLTVAWRLIKSGEGILMQTESLLQRVPFPVTALVFCTFTLS